MALGRRSRAQHDSQGATASLRVTVVGSARTLKDSAHDGFVTRHVHLVSTLSSVHEVSVVVVQEPDRALPLHPRLGGVPRAEVQLPVAPETRWSRLSKIVRNLRRRRGPAEATALEDAVLRTQPDVVLTLGPWIDDVFEAVHRRHPTVHLAEEDVYRMPFFSPSSLHGRAFRNAELISRRALRGQPRHVVVISDGERAYARRRFLGAPLTVLPFALDEAEWPVADGPADGTGVLVAGMLAEERNATGLALVLSELERRGATGIPFTLVSDAGLHPSLTGFLRQPWVTHVPSRDPLSAQYRQARMAVVPALQATGMKTTILQAWSSGLPVATYRSSAETVPRAFRSALAVAVDAPQLADEVVSLYGDAHRRKVLADLGLNAITSQFSTERNTATLMAIINQLAPRPAAGRAQQGGTDHT